jgi:UDP-N-acetylmuramoyl-tripeptide--D-alanyl-D-alanine ligase
MLEMGVFSNKEHVNIIKTCEKLKLDTIYVGDEFSKLTKKSFKRLTDLEKFLKKNPIKNKTILIKGSRGIRLENIVKSL